MNARPFDPHWTTDLPSLLAYLDDLCRTIGETETRGKNRKAEAQANFEAAIKAIVLDLYCAHSNDPSLHVGIALHRNTLQHLSKSQYGTAMYTPTSFEQAVKGLLHCGYITQTANFYRDRYGPVAVWCRSFDSIYCNKGD